MSETFTDMDLRHFWCTEEYHYMEMFPRWQYTDGVHFLTEKNCCWMVTDILATLSLHAKVRNEEFVSITFTKNADGSAKISYGNGNGKTLYTQQYDMTDCPVNEIKFFATTNVLLLASEY